MNKKYYIVVDAETFKANSPIPTIVQKNGIDLPVHYEKQTLEGSDLVRFYVDSGNVLVVETCCKGRGIVMIAEEHQP